MKLLLKFVVPLSSAFKMVQVSGEVTRQCETIIKVCSSFTCILILLAGSFDY